MGKPQNLCARELRSILEFRIKVDDDLNKSATSSICVADSGFACISYQERIQL